MTDPAPRGRAVLEAVSPDPHPKLEELGGSVFVVYPADHRTSGITLEYARLVERKDEISAEVTVTTVMAGELAWSRLNLSSLTARKTFAKVVEDRCPEAP